MAMVGSSGAASPAGGASAEALAADLAERFWKRLCIFAVRRLRDRSAAEDIAQETLRRVLEALRHEKIDNLEALPAFVFQTARNVCLHHGRSARRQDSALLKFRAGMRATTGDEEDPLIGLIDEARREQVRDALGNLADDDRDLLLMLYVDGLKSSEIARRLGIDSGTLRVRKHRALRRLAEILGNVST